MSKTKGQDKEDLADDVDPMKAYQGDAENQVGQSNRSSSSSSFKSVESVASLRSLNARGP